MAGLKDLTTEEIDPAYANVHELPAELQVMNQEGGSVADAVAGALPAGSRGFVRAALAGAGG